MAYHYSQRLHSNGIKGVNNMTTTNESIGNIWWFVSVLMRRDRNKTWHKQLISNWYKYQQENQTKILIFEIKRTYYVW